MSETPTIDASARYSEGANSVRHYSTCIFQVRGFAIAQGVVLLSGAFFLLRSGLPIYAAVCASFGFFFSLMLWSLQRSYWICLDSMLEATVALEGEPENGIVGPWAAYYSSRNRAYGQPWWRLLVKHGPYSLFGVAFFGVAAFAVSGLAPRTAAQHLPAVAPAQVVTSVQSQDSSGFALATMVIGAILGVALAPLSDAISRIISKEGGQRNDGGLHSALFFLLVANSVWILGEVLYLLKFTRSAWASASTAVVFLIAVLALALAFRQLRPGRKGDQEFISFLENRTGPLAWFLVGNLFWIAGETAQLVLDAFYYQFRNNADQTGVQVRAIFSSIGVVLLLVAAVQMAKRREE